jgi:pimeloyl-ACP methyl ester carboxylesterase
LTSFAHFVLHIVYFRDVSKQLLFLHGAIGSSAQLKPLADALQHDCDPVLFDFTGHGGREFPSAPFSITLFAEEVIQRMDELNLRTIDIFGYSMGGYVGLYLARHYPDRVGKLLTVATKLAWDVATAQKEVKMLDAEKIAEKVPKFAAALEKRHAPRDWKENLKRTAAMMLAMGEQAPLSEDDFKHIAAKVRMCVGDRDTMVSLEETIAVYRVIPGAGLSVLPETPHPIEQMNVQRLASEIKQFMMADD